MAATNVWETPEWAALAAHASGSASSFSLSTLLSERTLQCGFEGWTLDYSRQLVSAETLSLLHALAARVNLTERIAAMACGQHINTTEGRAVLHMALRCKATDSLVVDGRDVCADVRGVQGKIQAFVQGIRSGTHVGASGKPLRNIVSIGIGGSYLGVEFAYEALRTDPTAKAAAQGYTLRFLANVDPIDIARAFEGLDPEETLVLVISKTFTTAETMLNAKSARHWLQAGLAHLGGTPDLSLHMCAVSTAVPLVTAFGIKEESTFGFWDWVGGRYSVCSAVGLLPLALVYGWPVVADFLAGANSMDEHFVGTASPAANLPVTMGLLGVWNATFLGFPSRALLPYCQALLRLPAHIQQVSMESNGKRVALDGSVLPFPAGPIEFGEPGTNGQHSFYQLIHQGRVIPADFVGFVRSQTPLALAGEPVSNHAELMCNFFAQPDALALGKGAAEVRSELGSSPGAEALVPHKVFSGNRPSLSLLGDVLNARTLGQLLALYEHRTAVEGFLWGVNSFDQWGVELGKKLAGEVRRTLAASAAAGGALPQAERAKYNASTAALLEKFCSSSAQ